MNDKEKNTGYTTKGFKRLWNAIKYSSDGFKAAFVNEEAFRQELILALILVPLAIFLPVGLLSKAMMISGVVIVLIVEIINSAVEAIVDKTSPEKHPLAKRAKDMGSAAVFLSLVNLTLIWVFCLVDRFF